MQDAVAGNPIDRASIRKVAIRYVSWRNEPRVATDSSGWKLVARVVRKVARYDGRPLRGEVVARVPVPDGLSPGQSVEVTLPGIPLPASNGRWLLKLDVNLPGGDALSRHGVVGPQLLIDTVAP